MSRSIVLALIVLVLVILAIQNMAPPIALVILGKAILTLPLAVWLVGAIATGAILTLVIYGLASTSAPSRRPYRPLGQRIPPEDDRRTASAHPGFDQESTASRRFTPDAQPAPGAPRSAYDTDWESFKAPQQWDNWGERPDPQTVASQKTSQATQSKGFFGFKRPPNYSVDASVSEIESGWEDYPASPASARGGSDVADSLDEISEGWDDEYGGEETPYEETEYQAVDSSTHRRDDTVTEEIFKDDDNLGPAQVGPDGVYEADYRVIIPPYKPLKDEKEE
jgi:hypothetical protein